MTCYYNNYNYFLLYKNIMKFYCFYFFSTLLLCILNELKIQESYIFLIYLTFVLWYFNIVSFDKLLIFAILGYFLYENGIIHSIEQKINDKYIEYVRSVHENTGLILAEFNASQSSINNDL